MFHAIITVLAGYWRPSWPARVWLWLFFLSVRVQSRFRFTPSHLEASESESHVEPPMVSGV